jgi:cysteinyl-tRNA synthetase
LEAAVSDVSCDYANGLLAQLETAERALAETRAECERLRADRKHRISRMQESIDAHLATWSRLAAANALLTRIIKYAREDKVVTARATRLARVLSEVEIFLDSAQPAAPARTEAEQAVLDAMARVHERALRASMSEKNLAEACDAELARRGAK